jgi:hypothetical protein
VTHNMLVHVVIRHLGSVICKRLKEKKSYLVWNIVGCIGVTTVNNLVRGGMQYAMCMWKKYCLSLSDQ